MLKKVLQICAVSAFCWSAASAYEIVIDSTYHKDGRDDSNQVVYDPQTSLMWQDDESVKSVRKNWEEVIEYCQNLNLAGYSDWKLPSQKELRTIVDKNNSPTIKSEFKNIALDNYWSSTPVEDDNLYIYGIRFDGTYDETHNDKDHYFLVRCVRSGQ